MVIRDTRCVTMRSRSRGRAYVSPATANEQNGNKICRIVSICTEIKEHCHASLSSDFAKAGRDRSSGSVIPLSPLESATANKQRSK